MKQKEGSPIISNWLASTLSTIQQEATGNVIASKCVSILLVPCYIVRNPVKRWGKTRTDGLSRITSIYQEAIGNVITSKCVSILLVGSYRT